MFDVGFWELLLIAVLCLLVVGPERLPRLARTVGAWAGRAKLMVQRLKAEVDREVDRTEREVTRSLDVDEPDDRA